MNTFLHVWEHVDAAGKFGIGAAIFVMVMTVMFIAASAFDSTVGRWCAHRWPLPKDGRADDEEDN